MISTGKNFSFLFDRMDLVAEKRLVDIYEPMVQKAITTTEIAEFKRNLEQEFGPPGDAFPISWKYARRADIQHEQRVSYLDSDLEYKWERPLKGAVQPCATAAELYTREIGERIDVVVFLNELRSLRRHNLGTCKLEFDQMHRTLVQCQNFVESAFSQFQIDDAKVTLSVVEKQAEGLCDLWEMKIGIDEPVLFENVKRVTSLPAAVRRLEKCSAAQYEIAQSVQDTDRKRIAMWRMWRCKQVLAMEKDEYPADKIEKMAIGQVTSFYKDNVLNFLIKKTILENVNGNVKCFWCL